MKKIETLKKAVKIVIGFGVATIVKDIIEKNVDTDTPTKKVSVSVASYAIGGAVATAAGEYTDRQIDELVEAFQKIKTRKNAPEAQD